MGSKATPLPGPLYELGKKIKTKLEQNEKKQKLDVKERRQKRKP